MISLRHISLIILVLFSTYMFATHNRAGEITYKRIQPFTTMVGGIQVQVYTYSITVTLYTDFGDQKADRCQDTLYFGDGDKAILDRLNGTGPIAGCRCAPRCGEIIINQPGYGVKKNVYATIHTYPGAGTYLIRTFDRNRNENVVNIPNSVNQPFYVEAYLVITSFTGANSSPVFNFPPIDKACALKCFYHNPGAFDPDKDDSLSYEITASRGSGGVPVIGYATPDPGPNGNYGIDARTGLVSWCNPQVVGEYNIAFIVKEWRKNTSGVYQLIGYVLRDMQVIVEACPLNDPPLIILPVDTCVEAGTLIDKNIYVGDPNNGQVVTLEGGGGAFSADSPQASLSNTTAITYSPAASGGYYAHFVWQTTCDHVKNLPYNTTFKALDDGKPTGIKLPFFATYAIKVFPPSVKNVSATPNGTGIRVSWQKTSCSPQNNPLVAYKIYRKNDCTPVIPQPCKTGLYDSNSYTLVARTSPSITSVLDNNNGNGLVVGQDYGYLVIGEYADGTDTYASSQVCAKLIRDVPVTINVDVLSTSVNSGSILVRWCKPRPAKGDFDTSATPGPYQFLLKHKTASGAFETIFSTQNSRFMALDTVYIHAGINTNDFSHQYYVEFTAAGIPIGNSQRANSVYLHTSPSDRKVFLTWDVSTPWTNKTYTIYRKNPGNSAFTAIGTTSSTSYLDTKNVVNKHTYCYKVESNGAFSDLLLPKPLINHSQEACADVVDFTPPCSPSLSIEADCPSGYVRVNWKYLNSVCDSSDDVVSYVLYFKPTLSDEYYKIATLTNTSATNYVFEDLKFVSGCYAMTAIDSSNNTSKLSIDYCVDNCPEFELPNIFTPNGDNANDYYQAIKVRQINTIDLTIYDRWGNPIYQTNDPYFKWDGTSSLSKKQASEGTFFYACVVYEPRVIGLVKRTLKGFLQLSK